MGEKGVIEMGDIPDASLQSQMPVENISGIGVAGPSAEPSEEETAEVAVEETAAVQRESAEYSEEHLGRNIDVEA
jgi:hypothetical protein